MQYGFVLNNLIPNLPLLPAKSLLTKLEVKVKLNK